jgi:dihydroflavonol-4-reductase
MKVLLTGATGYLGAHIQSVLDERGIEFSAVSRAPQDDGRFVMADLLNEEGLAESMKGFTCLIHAAGMVSHAPEDADHVWRIHVEGTRNVLKAAKEAGINRVVYLSTSGTIAVSDDPKCFSTEEDETPFSLIKDWPYYRSKLYAEQLALEASCPEMSVLSLNPTLLLGPGDRSDGESTKSIRMFLDDQLPMAPSGGLSFADVRDVAETVVDALESGAAGERYLLASSNMPFLEFYQKIARIADKPLPMGSVPKRAHKVLKLFPGWKEIGRTVGLELKREDLILASHYWYADSSKAEDQLGWAPRDPLATLEDTVHDIVEKQNSFMPWPDA